MSRWVPESVFELLQESLQAWGVAGTVKRASDGSLELKSAAVRLSIERANVGLPFRWLIVSDARRRPASGIAGLLRGVRAAIDANYRPVPVRITPLPPPP
jgi:hypothetical protein